MAKRRKLETPSADDLGKIEAEFRRETPTRGITAPIAQVAAEAAGQYQTGTAEMRRDEAQAAAYRVAEGQGRLIKEIALEEIEANAMQRDRTIMDDDALQELEHSIAGNGLRLPIEVYALRTPDGNKRYGLLSGYRRFIAQQNVLRRTGDNSFARIKSVVRDPDQMGGAFVAMVEENEIRQDLSHYERGRIAAIAAQQGAFESTEDAVAHMFAAASKAKRSKIRSFAMIFEELGDVLKFPESLREKDGLRMAQALRSGTETPLRDALGRGQAEDARAEWALIEGALTTGESTIDPRRGGRPKTSRSPQPTQLGVLRSNAGVTLQSEVEKDDYIIRLKGKGLSDEVVEQAMQAVLKTLNSI